MAVARAVYADADVVALDDPLAALDVHVGRALLQQCVVEALADKTVVLVASSLHFLHLADQVRALPAVLSEVSGLATALEVL